MAAVLRDTKAIFLGIRPVRQFEYLATLDFSGLTKRRMDVLSVKHKIWSMIRFCSENVLGWLPVNEPTATVLILFSVSFSLVACSSSETAPVAPMASFNEQVGVSALLFNEIGTAETDLGRTPTDYVLPTTGSANYAGILGMEVSSAVAGAAEDQTFVGDVNITLDFDTSSNDAIRGTWSNIQDEDTRYSGTLVIAGDEFVDLPFSRGPGFYADMTGSFSDPVAGTFTIDSFIEAELIAPGGGELQYLRGDVDGTMEADTGSFIVDGGFAAEVVE